MLPCTMDALPLNLNLHLHLHTKAPVAAFIVVTIPAPTNPTKTCRTTINRCARFNSPKAASAISMVLKGEKDKERDGDKEYFASSTGNSNPVKRRRQRDKDQQQQTNEHRLTHEQLRNQGKADQLQEQQSHHFHVPKADHNKIKAISPPASPPIPPSSSYSSSSPSSSSRMAPKHQQPIHHTHKEQHYSHMHPDPEQRKIYNSLYREAQKHATQGEYAEARQIYTKLTQSFPYDGRFWLAFAQMEARAGRLETARQLFRRGAESNESSKSHLYHAWAVLEERSGNADKARELFRRVLEIDPYDPLAYQALALLEDRHGKFDDALRLFERAAEKIARPGASFWNAYGVMLQKHKLFDKAVMCFENATTADPYHVRSWQAWAICHERLEDYERAKDLFEKALKVDPMSAPTYQAYGLFQARLGNLDSASKLFEQGLEKDPHHAPLYHALARLEEQRGNYELAREVYERGLREDPESAVMLRSWACMELKLGHIDSSADWSAPFLPKTKVKRSQLAKTAENFIMLRKLIDRRSKDDLRSVLTWLNRRIETDRNLYNSIVSRSEDDTMRLMEWAKRRSMNDIDAFGQWFDKNYEQDRRIGSYIFGWNLPKRTMIPVESPAVKIPDEWYHLAEAPRKALKEADELFFNDDAVEYSLIAEFIGSFANNLSGRTAMSAALLGMSVLLVLYGAHSGLFDAAMIQSEAVALVAPTGVDSHLIELHGSVFAEGL